MSKKMATAAPTNQPLAASDPTAPPQPVQPLLASCASSSNTKQAFKARVRHWSQHLEQPLAALAIRPMRRKWASCSSRGQLSFSRDLLPLDLELWDYVIVHELLHLRVANHGRLWKALMRAHLGDWEQTEQRLRQHC